ncbi:BapA/Bap/LapF family prefix-like domain-containing protein [Pseudomonas guineae]|uniref:BapA/Bap/LapF family prefix-like domain-containing protein n=1 Tax=Pseudomonas guineae TaxID=425504 RepID=UPI0030EF708F
MANQTFTTTEVQVDLQNENQSLQNTNSITSSKNVETEVVQTNSTTHLQSHIDAKLYIDVHPDEVVSMTRSGNDMLVQLEFGELVVIDDYYLFEDNVSLFFQDHDAGLMWEIEPYPSLYDGSVDYIYHAITTADELAAAGLLSGTAATEAGLSAAGILGVAGVIGAIGLAASSGSGSGGGGGGGGGEITPEPGSSDTQSASPQTARVQSQPRSATPAADEQSALDTISAYAEDPVNNPAPTEQDFVDAGVTGVTADNLDAVNAEVSNSITTNADSTTEVQVLTDSGIATQQAADQQAALDTISAYAEDPVNNPAPTEQDFVDAV